MKESKTISVINKYNSLISDIEKGNRDYNEDEKFLLCNIEFDLAKSLIQDFRKEAVNKLAKILLAMTDDDFYYGADKVLKEELQNKAIPINTRKELSALYHQLEQVLNEY